MPESAPVLVPPRPSGTATARRSLRSCRSLGIVPERTFSRTLRFTSMRHRGAHVGNSFLALTDPLGDPERCGPRATRAADHHQGLGGHAAGGRRGTRPHRDARTPPHQRRAGPEHARPDQRRAGHGAHRLRHALGRARALGGGRPGGTGATRVPGRRSSRPGESHPRGALRTRRSCLHASGSSQPPRPYSNCQCANRSGSRRAMRRNHWSARRHWPRKRVYLRRAHFASARSIWRSVGYCRLTKGAVIVDPATDRRVVHLGQVLQGPVGASWQSPAPHFLPDGLGRFLASSRVEFHE